jgi:hypothetical protein
MFPEAGPLQGNTCQVANPTGPGRGIILCPCFYSPGPGSLIYLPARGDARADAAQLPSLDSPQDLLLLGQEKDFLHVSPLRNANCLEACMIPSITGRRDSRKRGFSGPFWISRLPCTSASRYWRSQILTLSANNCLFGTSSTDDTIPSLLFSPEDLCSSIVDKVPGAPRQLGVIVGCAAAHLQ